MLVLHKIHSWKYPFSASCCNSTPAITPVLPAATVAGVAGCAASQQQQAWPHGHRRCALHGFIRSAAGELALTLLCQAPAHSQGPNLAYRQRSSRKRMWRGTGFGITPSQSRGAALGIGVVRLMRQQAGPRAYFSNSWSNWHDPGLCNMLETTRTKCQRNAKEQASQLARPSFLAYKIIILVAPPNWFFKK
jgi:hypothetical protein